MSETSTQLRKKTQVTVNAETLQKLKPTEEKQVIIHGKVKHHPFGSIRIWQSTYLIPKNSEMCCKLIHAENIAFYPNWYNLGESGKGNFTLIFEGLPGDCKIFDLIEIIPEPGGFEVKNIIRNDQDVYHINF